MMYGQKLTIYFSFPILLLAILFLAGRKAEADAGHDSAKKISITTNDSDQVKLAISGSGEVLELTIHYSSFQAGEKVPLQIFLANLKTNEPISSATLSLTITGPSEESKVEAIAEKYPGMYSAIVSLHDKDANYSIFVEIQAGEEFDLFDIEGFKVPEPIAMQSSQQGAKSGADSGSGPPLMVILAFGMVIAVVSFMFGIKMQGQSVPKKKKSNEVETE